MADQLPEIAENRDQAKWLNMAVGYLVAEVQRRASMEAQALSLVDMRTERQFGRLRAEEEAHAIYRDYLIERIDWLHLNYYRGDRPSNAFIRRLRAIVMQEFDRVELTATCRLRSSVYNAVSHSITALQNLAADLNEEFERLVGVRD